MREKKREREVGRWVVFDRFERCVCFWVSIVWFSLFLLEKRGRKERCEEIVSWKRGTRESRLLREERVDANLSVEETEKEPLLLFFLFSCSLVEGANF